MIWRLDLLFRLFAAALTNSMVPTSPCCDAPSRSRSTWSSYTPQGSLEVTEPSDPLVTQEHNYMKAVKIMMKHTIFINDKKARNFYFERFGFVPKVFIL